MRSPFTAETAPDVRRQVRAARSSRARTSGATIDRLEVAAYTIPTEQPESDGTLSWDATTMIVVRPTAAGVTGFGYAYADTAAARVVADVLAPEVLGGDALDVPAVWAALSARVRNIGRPGLVATAISAVDTALWDLKARLVGLSLADLLGRAHELVPAYASGGFTSYDDDALDAQLAGFANDGFRFVKMKVGRRPERDVERVAVARRAVGEAVELFVDANGGYRRKEALAFAERFASAGVTWFEEPVSSDDVAGLRLLRDRSPAGMAIAAGEYGWDLFDFRRLLEAGAVDILQADATRCLGVSGWIGASVLCEAFAVPLSAHTAPSLHLQLCAAARPAIQLEWFVDHVRIERRLFDGFVEARDGVLAPEWDRPGLGLELREVDAEPFLVWGSR